MTLEQLHSLNEDETSMLWYILNKIDTPVLTGIEIEPSIFTSVNKHTLKDRVIKAEPKINNESKPIYENLKMKVI